MAGREAPSSEELLKRLDANPELKKKEKTFDIATSLGKLYYVNGRYADAADFLRQAMGKAAKAPKASVLETESMLADALFLSGDSAAALTEYAKVLQADPQQPDSLYGHAGLLLELKGDSVPSLKTARAELARFLELRPESAKAGTAHKLLMRLDEAIAEGGMTALNHKRATTRPTPPLAAAPAVPPMMAAAPAQDAPPALTPQMMQAVQNTEMTPEMVAGLGKLVEEGEDHLAHAQYQEALDTYKRVIPFQPDNGRARAGMAWALVGLGRPMGDRIWTVAIQSDASAVDKLGDVLAAKGDGAGAKALWKKLSETAPDYASQSGLAKKLR
jgi:tetratricopeptide (TPR) repeat protein